MLFLAAPIAVSSPEAVAQTVAGVTPGALSVEASGSASYSIPISVPPGTGGMVPSLSLNYGSQGGNGLLGVGWSLGGLSVIHRCPTTLEQDGFIDGVDYDTNDKFCLDGQRLVAVNGAYGANLTEYRTEIDGFAKIVSHGAAGAGPASFTVWTKSGQVMECGATADARIEAKGWTNARLWAVNKIEDTAGNYLTVSYFEDNANGEFRPTHIYYTGNSAAGLTPYNLVHFVYEVRPDPIVVYEAGSSILGTHRLTNVQTYAESILVRDYRLSYEPATPLQRSAVASITECSPNECLAPTLFDWLQGQPPAWGNFTGLAAFSPAHGFTDDNTYPLFTGDWNGDGLTDFGRVTGNGIAFQLSTGTTWVPYTGIDNAWSPAQGFTDNNTYPLITGDWNGDGLTDFGRVTGNGVAFKVSYGNGWLPYPLVDGNFSPAQGFTNGNTYPLFTGDWNGDGRTDIGRVHGSGVAFYVSTGSGWVPYTGQAGFAPATGFADNTTYPLITGDWNGDGLTDFGRVTSDAVAFQASNGSGWVTYTTYPHFSPAQGFANASTYPLVTGDWDGNGLTDIGRVHGGGFGFVVSVTMPKLLTRITDGLGAQTNIGYRALTDATIYTKGVGALYPQVDIQAPLWVTTVVSKDDGTGGQSVTSYKYGGAKAHLRGRGYLGFAWMQATDQQTGIVTRTDYRQDFPFTGQVVASKTYMPDAGGEILVKRLSNTWAVKPLNGGATQAPYVSQSTAEAFEFNDGVQP